VLFFSFNLSAFLRGVTQFVVGFKLKLSGTCKVYFGFDKNGECHAETLLEVLLCGVQKFQAFQKYVSTILHSHLSTAVGIRYLRRNVKYCWAMMTEAYIY
jgi:hypothetical protein